MAFQQLDLFATFLAEEEPVKQRETSSQKIAVDILNQIPHADEREEETQPEPEVMPAAPKQILPAVEIAPEAIEEIPEKNTRRNNLDVIFDDGIIRVMLIKEKDNFTAVNQGSEVVAEEDEIVPAFEYGTLEEPLSIVEEILIEEDEVVPAVEYVSEEDKTVETATLTEEDEIVPAIEYAAAEETIEEEKLLVEEDEIIPAIEYVAEEEPIVVNEEVQEQATEEQEIIGEQHIAAFEEAEVDFAHESILPVEEENEEIVETVGLQPMIELPGHAKRGRKSYKEIDATADLIEVPDDETLNQKLYYSISEVATWFKLNTSQIRFWENEFDILKPRKNRKGDRLFRVEDIHNLKVIYYLLRNRKFSIEGAKEYLKNNKHKVDVNIQMVQSLTMFKSFLLELKANLGS